MVRVYLSSLGNVDTLHVTIDGNYLADGMTDVTMSRGDTVEIRFDRTSGEMTMQAQGTSYVMGRELHFRRRQTSGTNGVRIAEAKKNGNLYPGDLQLVAMQSGGSWRLYPIMHVFMEDYLCGVVPYEMGNSAPLEALKAQAVAARTYTLNKMNQRSSQRYDVVDTTNDQVYYGNSTSTTRCTEAVLATKGIVLTNGGALTSCWYTASNGGQTESAANFWGSKGYPYLVVKDDPFDYQNSASTVKKVTVYQDFDAAGQSIALKSLLQREISNRWGSNATIDCITAVIPHTPRYSAPSRLYTKMDFRLQVQVNGVARTETVTVDIFDALENALGLSINGTDNELWSVSAKGDSFEIAVRRYGHGVGMSQRGAMRMGQLGYGYDQILGFYYEQSLRVQYAFVNRILSGVDNATVETVEEAAVLTPSSQAKATIKLPGTDSRAALRGTPSTDGTLIAYADNGAMVTPLSTAGDWTLVQYGGVKGYVQTTQIQLMGEVPQSSAETATASTSWALITCSGTLNLRSAPSLSAAVQTTMPSGSVLVVLGMEKGFAKVQYGAQIGYASMEFLRLSETYPGTAQESSQVAYTAQQVTLRPKASLVEEGTALMEGVKVILLEDDGTWCRVEAAGSTGYLLRSELTFQQPEITVTPAPSQPAVGQEGRVQAESGVAYLFTAPGVGGNVLCGILNGESLLVIAQEGSWCTVRYGGQTCYIPASNVTFHQENAAIATGVVTTVSGSLNLRSKAQTGSTILTRIPQGAKVSVFK